MGFGCELMDDIIFSEVCLLFILVGSRNEKVPMIEIVSSTIIAKKHERMGGFDG
jgi:hypothetical protein